MLLIVLKHKISKGSFPGWNKAGEAHTSVFCYTALVSCHRVISVKMKALVLLFDMHMTEIATLHHKHRYDYS